MKNIKSVILLACVLSSVSCHRQPKLPNEEVIDCCGGYSEAREPDMDEYRLFREVTDKVEGMTFTPLTVQTQVVAGINYRFYCRFSDGSEEYSPGHCYITIYKPLPGQGEPTITSIERLSSNLEE